MHYEKDNIQDAWFHNKYIILCALKSEIAFLMVNESKRNMIYIDEKQ